MHAIQFCGREGVHCHGLHAEVKGRSSTLCYRTECNYCRDFIIVVFTVGNNIPALCICGNDGGNCGFAKYTYISLNNNDYFSWATAWLAEEADTDIMPDGCSEANMLIPRPMQR